MNVFNFSRKKVGGIWFVKLGRFTLSFSLSRAYRPIGFKPEVARWYTGSNTLELDFSEFMEVSNDRR